MGWGHVTTLPVGSCITQQEADDTLANDLNKFSDCVDAIVEIEVTDNQFSAMVSFAYNVGVGALKASKLLRFVNESDFTSAANDFLSYDHAGTAVVQGLLNRREAEKTLFQS